jgi:hypothetical protein
MASMLPEISITKKEWSQLQDEVNISHGVMRAVNRRTLPRLGARLG